MMARELRIEELSVVADPRYAIIILENLVKGVAATNIQNTLAR